MDEDKYLTVEEVSQKLQVSKMTIYRYINSGKLPAYKLEQEFRINSADLTHFLKTRKTTK